MNYLEIKELLREQDQKEVIKAIFSYELLIGDEEKLEELYDFYYEHPMPNFLDFQLCEVAESSDWI